MYYRDFTFFFCFAFTVVVLRWLWKTTKQETLIKTCIQSLRPTFTHYSSPTVTLSTRGIASIMIGFFLFWLDHRNYCKSIRFDRIRSSFFSFPQVSFYVRAQLRYLFFLFTLSLRNVISLHRCVYSFTFLSSDRWVCSAHANTHPKSKASRPLLPLEAKKKKNCPAALFLVK